MGLQTISKSSELIDKLDFTNLKRSLSKKGINDVDSVEKQYKDFLLLIATSGGKQISPPSPEVDEFWHAHILDTKRYHVDCEAIFGKYIHHIPSHSSYFKKLVLNEGLSGNCTTHDTRSGGDCKVCGTGGDCVICCAGSDCNSGGDC